MIDQHCGRFMLSTGAQGSEVLCQRTKASSHVFLVAAVAREGPCTRFQASRARCKQLKSVSFNSTSRCRDMQKGELKNSNNQLFQVRHCLQRGTTTSFNQQLVIRARNGK